MRQLEVSRAGRESSGLKMASRLDGAVRRETGKVREEEKESEGEVDQERGQERQTKKSNVAITTGYLRMRSWVKETCELEKSRIGVR